MPRLPLLARVLRSITLRWLLALLLLVAQQGALTHALGHAAGHAHEPVAALQAQSPLYQARSDALDQHQAPGKRMLFGERQHGITKEFADRAFGRDEVGRAR